MFGLFNSKNTNPIKTVDVITLKKWMESDEVLLIDVREVEENKASRIKDAKLVPLAEVCLQKITSSKCGNPNCNCKDCSCSNCNCRDKKLVIHCRSGKRSEIACAKLLEENPNLEIYNLEGGILAWSAAGNEVLS